MAYQDRRDAGKSLAIALAGYSNPGDAIVLGLPRGGVPVAFEVAQALHAPLDVLVVRKLGAPGQSELAMGAVTSDGTVFLNDIVIRDLHIREEIVRAVTQRERLSAEQQERLYRQARPAPPMLADHTVILVDDGLATGATMRTAIRSVRSRARHLIVAAPVGSAEACSDLASEADLVVCPRTPVPFGAVGQFYHNFQPTSDDEVRWLLADAAIRS